LKLTVQDHEKLAQAAANNVEKRLEKAISGRDMAHLILATGNSQLKFLASLRKTKIQWNKVIVFHLDEYLGLDQKHPASFRNYLRSNIIDAVKPHRFYPLDADREDLDQMIKEYDGLLRKYPVDVACIGIGENGHLAFNDPGVADFNDKKLIKEVLLDRDCRLQQLNEGWFEDMDAVPKKAITLTIPAIMNAKHINCFVPDNRKAKAVKNALEGDIVASCPASVLRKHSSVNLFLDPPAASLLS
jgi:glucosamine-6-phosphate deaminase